MKSSAEKSSTTTSTPAAQAAEKPFFGKAGGGDFFKPGAGKAPVVQAKSVSKPSQQIHQPIQKKSTEKPALDALYVAGHSAEDMGRKMNAKTATFEFQTFIPDKFVPGLGPLGFGDGRGFGNPGDSYRTYHKIVIQTNEKINQKGVLGTPEVKTGVSETFVPFFSGQASAGPLFIFADRKDPKSVNVYFGGSIKNGAKIFGQMSPAIDYKGRVTISKTGHEPEFSFAVMHDAFPAYEAFLSGRSIYRWSYPAGSTILKLIGSGTAMNSRRKTGDAPGGTISQGQFGIISTEQLIKFIKNPGTIAPDAAYLMSKGRLPKKFDGKKDSSWDPYGSYKTNKHPLPRPRLEYGGPGTDDKHKLTHMDKTFVANKNITPSNFSAIMLSGFVHGTGPENYRFGPNHAVSRELLNSRNVKEALILWGIQNKAELVSGLPLDPKNDFDEPVNFGKMDQVITVLKNHWNVLAVDQFLGSATISVRGRSNNSTVIIRIFNVTSKGSGDILKELGRKQEPSRLRDPNLKRPQPYSNISQEFILAVPLQSLKKVLLPII